jgi:Fis family transcriptional regulator, factor for inversion stimulation protein
MTAKQPGAVTSAAAVTTQAQTLPLRSHAERALRDYLAHLDGHAPADLYAFVLREVEEPLFRAVLDHCGGNQSQAAVMLGINRGTLRKKLRELGLSS